MDSFGIAMNTDQILTWRDQTEPYKTWLNDWLYERIQSDQRSKGTNMKARWKPTGFHLACGIFRQSALRVPGVYMLAFGKLLVILRI